MIERGIMCLVLGAPATLDGAKSPNCLERMSVGGSLLAQCAEEMAHLARDCGSRPPDLGLHMVISTRNMCPCLQSFGKSEEGDPP